MIPKTRRICEHVREDGSKCQAPALKKSEYCFTHDPASEDERHAARQRGGYNSRVYVNLPDVEPPTTAAEATALMARVLAAALRGEVQRDVADVTARACGVLLRGFQITDHEKRLAAIEQKLGVNPGSSTQVETRLRKAEISTNSGDVDEENALAELLKLEEADRSKS